MDIKNDELYGSSKTIVGSKQADLVLETLGKVYIKTGNSSRLLNDLFKLLDNPDVTNYTILVESSEKMETMEYPGDGYFIFNTLNECLYISYDNRYILLVQGSDSTDSGYVKKTGDTMSGQLEFTTDKAPLIVASSKLVSNFNAEYINGFESSELAKKALDEYITGNWTFNNSKTSFNGNVVLNKNTRSYGDIVTTGSIGSPEFASGYGGYGWRFDANTNMLTVDYLVVRKAMSIYQLVINSIKATNGALWVSDSSKCESSYIPVYLTSITSDTKLSDDTWYIPVWSGANNKTEISISGENLLYSDGTNPGDQVFINHRYAVYIKEIDKVTSSSYYSGLSTLADETLLRNPTDDEFFDNIKICYLFTPDTSYNFSMYNNTPKFIFVNKSSVTTDTDTNQSYFNGALNYLYLYYKYFAIPKSAYNTAIAGDMTVPYIRIVTTDTSQYPSFTEGDLLRCQKYSYGNLKYYDALVGNQYGSNTYVMFKGTSVFDKYTEIEYDESGNVSSYSETYNTSQYSKTNSEDTLADITKDDDLVKIGSITDVDRQNSVYITSSEDNGPYIDVITGLNRPDWSVLYYVPVYTTTVKCPNDGTFNKRYKFYVQTVEPTISHTTWTETIDNVETTYYGTLIPTKNTLIEEYDSTHYLCKLTTNTKVRLGNLSGVTNDMFGENQPYGFGLYSENVFLTGEFYLNNGKSVIDFSEENVLIKFKNAGISIDRVKATDASGNIITDTDGNPTYVQVNKVDLDGNVVTDSSGNAVQIDKTEIVMTANQIVFKAPNQTSTTYIAMFNVSDDGTKAWLDVQGSVQSHGLYIYPTGVTADPDNPEEGASVIITPEGDATLTGTVYATAGKFGDVEIKAVDSSYGNLVSSALYQLKEYTYGDTVYYRAAFKLGIGKKNLFDTNTAFLEIYNYANAFSTGDNRIGLKVTGHMNAAIWAAVVDGIGAPSKIPGPDSMVAGFFDGMFICTSQIMGRYVAASDNEYPGYYESDGYYHYYQGVSFNTNYDLDGIRLQVRDGIIIGVSNDSGHLKSKVPDSYGRYWIDGVPGTATVPTALTLNYESATIYLNNSLQLTATITPSTASGVAVDWESSNEEVASVSAGLVYAMAVGTTTITADAGGGIRDTCVITVSTIAVQSLSVSPSTLSLAVGESSWVNVYISPTNATNMSVRWITSNSAIATVTSSGYVTAVAEGTATITSISVDGGYTDSCVVTVTAAT